MLERFAAQVLNKYIGQYVENFNPENLSIGIVQGAVELEGLILRKDALKEFDLAGIEVKWGYIGKITLRIPSYKNYNEPWVIDINKLYVILGPGESADASVHAEVEKSFKEDQKRNQLLQLEEKWQATQGSSKSFYAIWRSYSSSIVTNIIENLQVRLYDLHLRYEDNTSLQETFSCGVYVDVLSAQTTDENWNIKTTAQASEKKWKKMHLKGMSLYWDTKSNTLNKLSFEELVSAMGSHSRSLDPEAAVDMNGDKHQYILSPVSGEARLVRACSPLPLRSRSDPRLSLHFDLPSIPLSLSKKQYCQMLALAGEMARWETRKRHQSGRPSESISENSRDWWNWAINKHLQKIKQQRQRKTLQFMLKRAKLIVNYVKKYRQLLTLKYVSKTSDQVLESSFVALQAEMTLQELVVLHELVYNQIDEENRRKKEANQAKPAKRGLMRKRAKEQQSQGWRWSWLGKWRGKEVAAEDTSSMEEELAALKKVGGETAPYPDQLSSSLYDSVYKDLNEQEIYEMFGDELTDEDSNDTFLKRDSVFMKLNFTLNSGSLSLIEERKNQSASESTQGIVSLEFNSVKIESEWRPRYGTHEIKGDLGSIVLRDLNPLNSHFCDLVKPSVRKLRPTSPINVTPPDMGVRSKATEIFSNVLSSSQTKPGNDSSTQDTSEGGERVPVLSVTYEKLPQTGSSQFSDRLEVVTAPLSLTILPGILDRLKKFFKTRDPSDSSYVQSGVESELLAAAAKQKYELWMKQAESEVKNTVRRIIEGKGAAKISKDKWAISLDIFAPEIVIPEDWSNPNSSIVILNLGHMTFENHEESELRPPGHRNTPGDQNLQQDEMAEYDSDEDEDFVTPPNTPPSETDFSSISQQSNESKRKSALSVNKKPFLDADSSSLAESSFMNQEQLTERMLWDKMYKQYHLRFADLQVLVASSRSKWDAYRHGGRGPMHLVNRFSVELLVERRVVPTVDPQYPALMLTGKLPHLTLHVNHKKIHTVMRCLERLTAKPRDRPSTVLTSKSRFDFMSPSRTSHPPWSKQTKPAANVKEVSVAKANSKQLACDFLINQVSVVLEEEIENRIISVLEISRIQTKFLERPYDTTVSLSIYSLLLVDVMQQLGRDYELLLASHRNVYIDVGSGNMLDSGTASPVSVSRSTSSSNYGSTTQGKRNTSDSSKLSLSTPTTNILSSVAENLRTLKSCSSQYFSAFRPNSSSKDLAADETENRVRQSGSAENFESLITLEIKNVRRKFPDLSVERDRLAEDASSCANQSPCTFINADFNNLDILFNANSWITILNFVHKLKPRERTSKPADAQRDVSAHGNLRYPDPHQLKVAPAATNLLDEPFAVKPSAKTCVDISFKKLNILLLRHISKLDSSSIGRKIATITMQGANVSGSIGSIKDAAHNNSRVDMQIDMSGSIASLQLQDLTCRREQMGLSNGYEILSIGTHETERPSDESCSPRKVEPEISSPKIDEAARAFYFEFTQASVITGVMKGKRIYDESYAYSSMSDPVIPLLKTATSISDTNASDSLLFKMDKEEGETVTVVESKVILKLASTCYIHSPRLIAEVLAFVDEIGDVARAQMTTAARQAYRDMAKSIMDKVSDYSKVMLGKSMSEDVDLTEVDSSGHQHRQSINKSIGNLSTQKPTKVSFMLQIQTPIVALPKFPGSYELLIANLGQITILNDHDFESGCSPMDQLTIDVENMNLRSHRQQEEEVAAKRASSSAPVFQHGPSISELKKDNPFRGTQILHKTSFQLTINKTDYTVSPRSALDVRHCCEKDDEDFCTEESPCRVFSSHVGLLSDTRMCVKVRAASAITVTLSKQAYEQVLKTLDNLAFGGDIDQIRDDFPNVFGNTPSHISPHGSSSAPDVLNVPIMQRKTEKVADFSGSSYQSTPQHAKDTQLFDLPGLEIPKQEQPGSAHTMQRKYTPISAEFSVPSLIFQLSGDLSEGEQGIVKVTLQRFVGAYQKENRFGTELDLSLGSLDIEDLLQSPDSADRHIVVSFSNQPGEQYSTPRKTDYLSSSCPAFIRSSKTTRSSMSTSLPVYQPEKTLSSAPQRSHPSASRFRPYDLIHINSGAHGSMPSSSAPVSPRLENIAASHSASVNTTKEKWSPIELSQESFPADEELHDGDTLVRIKAFLVDGNSTAYSHVYGRVNRKIDVDFNSLECKVNLQTWVVLLDFFGIGTSPKKKYDLDPKTEQMFSWDQRLAVHSYYENQPSGHVNSEIDFAVHSFNLSFNKSEYELLKANVSGVSSHVQLRDGMLRVSGQLGELSVSDLSPNGALYRERFIFTGDKALDFDIKKFDEYDHFMERQFDISVRLRMSSIRYTHTQRFQNETVAFCQHFQQLQEVLGRMRAASVGQSVRASSGRQARVLLDIEAEAPIILIPESSHSERLLVANLGHITIRNRFISDGQPGTLSYSNPERPTPSSSSPEPDASNQLLINLDEVAPLQHACLLDVIYVDLIDMDLFTASFSKSTEHHPASSRTSDTRCLVFPSYLVTCSARPLLKEKVKLNLQLERNLEKDITHKGVPDTALSAKLSSVYCALDHNQYWLVRGVLDHNTGEAIPDFPQPTAFLQPSKIQTVLSGAVYTGLSMDFYLTNVSIELLNDLGSDDASRKSLGRLDFVKSRLSYRAFSNNVKTTNLSCEAFRAHDSRFLEKPADKSPAYSVFTSVLGPVGLKKDPSPKLSAPPSLLQFEVYHRSGPDSMELTALLNNMRVYLILDWLLDIKKYLFENPNQERCDALRAKTAQLMARYGQIDSGNQRGLDSSGHLEPEVKSNEMKLSFTDTEFVLVEDTSRLDSDAVILSSTSVLHYFPNKEAMLRSSYAPFTPSPALSCSLQNLEVFSCQLDKENETALSIIDPITISFDVKSIKQSDLSAEEIESNPDMLDKMLLDIHVSELNIRVSYNDVMLFLNIFKSITSKTDKKDLDISAENSPISASPGHVKATFQPSSVAVLSLTELGYSKADVIEALSSSHGDVELAGSWLIRHAKLLPPPKVEEQTALAVREVPLDIAKIQFEIEVLRVCLIDDCAEDCDVPLAEMAVRTLTIRQALADHMTGSIMDVLLGQHGSATYKLSGDYYNRMLSMWEPFLESWRCNLSWRHELGRTPDSSGKWSFDMQASDRFDVTVTSTLIETAKKTAFTWQKDYAQAKLSRAVSLARKRQPFAPYVLRNLTGLSVLFATQTTALHEGDLMKTDRRASRSQPTNWVEVYPGEDRLFHFATSHEKQRHKRSQSLKLHQVIVQVGEWKVLQPVTVSKVGVYFRHAYKQMNKSSTVYEPLLPVRVVFSVALEGNAQKVVTLRSALTVRNRVKIPVQLQLRTPNSTDIHTLPVLDPGETQYVPLALTSCEMKIRPYISSSSIPSSYHYSTTSIRWQHVPAQKQEHSQWLECNPANSEQQRFFFAVCIKRLPYPTYEEVCEMLHQQGELMNQRNTDWEECPPQLPGHTIIILPPVVISNLLPCDLYYYVKNKRVEGTLKPGVDATPHGVYLSPSNHSSLIVGCLIEGFQSCRELIVPAVVKNYQVRMLIKDLQGETLVLNVRILWRLGCSVKISIIAGYWIINKTGLPIVVKQEGTSCLAAGQYEAHELARSLQPLLFSYANCEAPYLCTMRLGKKARIEDVQHGEVGRLHGIPIFCERFSTDGGLCTRNLKLITNDGTPNREFCIGISVRRGWGRYLHTHIVTIAPRFLLINKTKSHHLCFAQRHTISYSADASGRNCHLRIIPGSSCVFHWPRVDLDTLLCVRLADEPSCHWSGGFFIDKTDAFHVALRLSPSASLLSLGSIHPLAPHCIFLTVEVTLTNATYCIAVSDADPSVVPPPLRIDNVSYAPINFKQVGTDESYNTEVPAETQLAYACDEPCLRPKIRCSVRGDSSYVELNMDIIGEEKQLYYENYFYITVGSPQQSSTMNYLSQDHNKLVLDVQKGQRIYEITLQPLRSGKRSQLWRMTRDCRIYHEGSSPPEKSSSGLHEVPHAHRPSGLVLDIAEMALTAGRSFEQGIPLTLKRCDERRRSTQTWSFDDDGRLKCRHKNLSVQVAELRVGQIVVLASYNEMRFCQPTELCYRHKLIAGSGCLSLQVVRDGPTRVLRVVDIRQKRAGIYSSSEWTLLESSLAQVTATNNDALTVLPYRSKMRLNASISMPLGVGISLISNSPEELTYLTMNGVSVNVSVDATEQVFTLKMQKMQIDNQLLDGYPPVMLSPRVADDSSDLDKQLPSSDSLISIQIIRQPSSSRVYQIFKSVVVDVGRLSIAVEERLLLKLLHFIGFGPTSTSRDSELLSEAKMDMNLTVNTMDDEGFTLVKRLYFGNLSLSAAPLRLSIFTASRLSAELKAVKQALSFPLIQFERAPVALQTYVKYYLFETLAFVLADFSKHLREQLMGQAAKILGSVDFLGNPIGLMGDVRAGFQAGLAEGNVQNMVKHITHGISDSTAKFTSALSDRLGEITMDEDFEDRRQAIQANARSSAGSHVVAGLHGFMAGVVGGLTSVVTQPVKGAQNEGAAGFFKGVVKGVVGTVAKPMAGVLDLASESASAVRYMSVSHDQIVARLRPIRCCHSFQGCLQAYSKSQADGQTFLYALNRNEYSEHFYSCDKFNCYADDNILVLITNKRVYFVKDGEPDVDHIMLVVDYADLLAVSVVQVQSDDVMRRPEKTFLELTMKSISRSGAYNSNTGGQSFRYQQRKPRVACHSRSVAERVCQQIRYAKNLASEHTETMHCDPDEEEARDRAFELEV